MTTSFGNIAPSNGFNIFLSSNNIAGENGNKHPNNSSGNASQRNKPNKNNNRFKQNTNRDSNNTNLAPKPDSATDKPVQKKLMMRRSSPQQDKAVGSIVSNPNQLGFQKIAHKLRETPRFLVGQQPQLKQREFVQDSWDNANQNKMSQLENSIDDLTELYETLKKMRDFERKIMENKGLVDKADFSKDLTEAINFQGTCQNMCPIFERARRNVEYTVYSYEKQDTSGKKASANKALKVFARPAAASAPPLPSDVRPPHILVKTLDYLVDNLLNTLPDSEGFIWDRMRSIRQDFTYQNYSGPEAIDCNERIVRIHLLIIHVMVKARVKFSLQQELEQLHKSLITLSEIYDDVRANGGSCPNEAEFRAYALLSKIRDPEYEKNIQELPAYIFQNNLVQMALCFRKLISNSSFSERGYIRTENCMNFYKRYFKLMVSGNVPFLMNSFLEIFVNEVRFYAFKAFSISLNKKHKTIPLNYFEENLLFNDADEIIEFCEYYSIDISDQGVEIKTLSHHSHKLAEAQPLKNSYLRFVDEQLAQKPYSEFINCGRPNFDSILENRESFKNDMLVIEDTSKIIEGVPAPVKKNKVLDQNPFTNYSTIHNQQSLKKEASPAQKSIQTPSKPSFSSSGNNQLPKSDEVRFLSIEASSRKLEAHNNNNKANNENIGNTKSYPKKSIPAFPIENTPMPLITQNNKTFEGVSTSAKHTSMFKFEEMGKTEAHIFSEPGNTLTGTNISTISQETLNKAPLIKKEPILFQHPILSNISKQDIGENPVEDSSIGEVIEISNPKLNHTKQISDLIQSLTEELYYAFLHEKFYVIFNQSKADFHYNSKIKKRFYGKWNKLLKIKQKQKEVEEKKREEIKNIGRQLGVPSFRKPSTTLLATPKNNRLPSSSFTISFSMSKDVPFSPVNNEINAFHPNIDQNNVVWKPFDLKKLYFDKMSKIYSKNEKMNADIFLYSENWFSISNIWLLKKFGLQDHKSIASFDESNISTSIKCVDDNFDPLLFSNLQLLVFNTGVTDSNIFDLELKLKQDGEELIKLVTGISLNSNICFSILIVYWDSTETPLDDTTISKYLKLVRISKNFSSVINNVVVTNMVGTAPQETLERGLVQVADNFTYRLTERGKYHESLQRRRSLAGIYPQEHTINVTKRIDEKMKKMLDSETEKHAMEVSGSNTYVHLKNHLVASPRFKKRKLPVLVSEIKNNKFRTPSAPVIDTSLSSSPIISSHLAQKFRKTQRIASFPDVITPGTPSHSRNLPNRSPMPNNQTPTITNIKSNHVEDRLPFRHYSSSRTPVHGPTSSASNNMERNTQGEIPDSLLELKSLIDSVKKKINHR